MQLHDLMAKLFELRQVAADQAKDGPSGSGAMARALTAYEWLGDNIEAFVDSLDPELTDPAPAGEAVEPVAWVIPGDDNANADGWIDCRADRWGEFTRPLYDRPAPEDTARLREDLERVTWEAVYERLKMSDLRRAFDEQAVALERVKGERDDARKALETAREDGRDWLFAEACKPKSEGGLGAFDNAVSWMKSKGCVLRAARSASREGATDGE